MSSVEVEVYLYLRGGYRENVNGEEKSSPYPCVLVSHSLSLSLCVYVKVCALFAFEICDQVAAESFLAT